MEAFFLDGKVLFLGENKLHPKRAAKVLERINCIPKEGNMDNIIIRFYFHMSLCTW